MHQSGAAQDAVKLTAESIPGAGQAAFCYTSGQFRVNSPRGVAQSMHGFYVVGVVATVQQTRGIPPGPATDIEHSCTRRECQGKYRSTGLITDSYRLAISVAFSV